MIQHSHRADVERLLEWFAANGRRLPWRTAGRRDPYQVWIAEVMLQQTRVPTVIPYFQRFLRLFPDVPALARAELDAVLKAWEGLGYYARARHAHSAARLMVERHAGRVPAERDALLALPGIGAYIAHAILSLAFGQDYLALDANGRRVLARWMGLERPLRERGAESALRAFGEALLPAGRAGAFNEALMDLSSLVCTPKSPACGVCPIQGSCQAHLQGRQEQIPARLPRRQVPHYDVSAAVIWQDGKVLLAQRLEEGMLGGLWEFPGGTREAGESLEECLRREIQEELGMEIAVGEHLISVSHAYTHKRITLHAFHCRPLRGTPQKLEVKDWRWVAPAEVLQYPLSVVDQRVAEALLSWLRENGSHVEPAPARPAD